MWRDKNVIGWCLQLFKDRLLCPSVFREEVESAVLFSKF